MPIDLDPAAFDAMVGRALDGLPDDLARLVDNVVVLVEPEAPADDPDLLGLYDGLALTERPANHAGMLPDRILLFRGPLLDMAADLGCSKETIMAYYMSNHIAVAYGDIFEEMVALSRSLGLRIRVLSTAQPA